MDKLLEMYNTSVTEQGRNRKCRLPDHNNENKTVLKSLPTNSQDQIVSQVKSVKHLEKVNISLLIPPKLLRGGTQPSSFVSYHHLDTKN